MGVFKDHKADLLLLSFIVLLAFTVRYVTLEDPGITWDEGIYARAGVGYVQSLLHFDVSASAWSDNSEHPPVAKYLYGIPAILLNGGVYNYQALVFAKIFSALLGTATCILVYLLCKDHLNRLTGLISAALLALTPTFVAHNQIAALDTPVAFFFTLTLFLFLRGMSRGVRLYHLAAAISLGLLLGTKFNGLLVLPVLLLSYLLYQYLQRPDRPTSRAASILRYLPLKGFLFYGLISAATLYLLWPWIWTAPGNLQLSLSHWGTGASPEFFLGEIQSAPLYYYPLYFLVTTPVLLLLLALPGIWSCARSKSWFKYTVLLWFLVPFCYGLSSFVMGGMRYLLLIYPAFAILCGEGLYQLANLAGRYLPEKLAELRKGALFAGLGLAVVLYLLVALASVCPYYLDYYNELSGGTSAVDSACQYNVGWWGEGIADAVRHVDATDPGSVIFLATVPNYAPNIYAPDNLYLAYHEETYNVAIGNDYDYVVTNSYAEKYRYIYFNESVYRLVYETTAQGAPLARVYKRDLNAVASADPVHFDPSAYHQAYNPLTDSYETVNLTKKAVNTSDNFELASSTFPVTPARLATALAAAALLDIGILALYLGYAFVSGDRKAAAK